MRSILAPSGKPSSHPVDVGQRTEAIILAELVKRGHKVLIRCGTNHRYDLVLDVGESYRVYALSPDEAASSSGSLRIDPTGNGQMKGIRWAADHELPA